MSFVFKTSFFSMRFLLIEIFFQSRQDHVVCGLCSHCLPYSTTLQDGYAFQRSDSFCNCRQNGRTRVVSYDFLFASLCKFHSDVRQSESSHPTPSISPYPKHSLAFPACPTLESRAMTLEKCRNFESVSVSDMLHGEHFILSPNTSESMGFEVIGCCKKDKSIEYELLFDDCVDDPIRVGQEEMKNLLQESHIMYTNQVRSRSILLSFISESIATFIITCFWGPSQSVACTSHGPFFILPLQTTRPLSTWKSARELRDAWHQIQISQLP